MCPKHHAKYILAYLPYDFDQDDQKWMPSLTLALLVPRISRLLRGCRRVFLVVMLNVHSKLHNKRNLTSLHFLSLPDHHSPELEHPHSIAFSTPSYYMEHFGTQKLLASCRVAHVTTSWSQLVVVFGEMMCA